MPAKRIPEESNVADNDPRSVDELEVDLDNLYQEEVFTDSRSASIRRLTPVDANGAPDPERPVMYIGETSLMTQMGPVPVSFQVEAPTLREAFAKFPDGVKKAIEQLNDRAREMMREEASRIVVPTGAPPEMGGGVPGAGPGGKIFLK